MAHWILAEASDFFLLKTFFALCHTNCRTANEGFSCQSVVLIVNCLSLKSWCAVSSLFCSWTAYCSLLLVSSGVGPYNKFSGNRTSLPIIKKFGVSAVEWWDDALMLLMMDGRSKSQSSSLLSNNNVLSISPKSLLPCLTTPLACGWYGVVRLFATFQRYRTQPLI